MLSNTILATTIPNKILSEIQTIGKKIDLAPNQILFQKGESPDYLYFILAGDILIEIGLKSVSWLGPGDMVGEIGFVLGTKRTRLVRAGSWGCTLWCVHRSLLFQESSQEITFLMTHILLVLAPHVQVQWLEILNEYQLVEHNQSINQSVNPSLVDNHCDFDHPSIQYVAKMLRGKDEWESAINVWQLVQSLPYRFGFWNVKASQTLELGFGMCTTKSNLQVALLRALNIESQFGETQVHAKYLAPFLLPAYLNKTKRQHIKHYFALVKLEGQWFRSDATFSKEALQMLAESYPQEYSHLLHEPFQRGKHFFYVKEEQVREDLSELMHKRPYYKTSNIEAMNILLDKRQGTSTFLPHWVTPILKLLNDNPQLALLRTMAALIVDLEKLHGAIAQRNRLHEDYST